MSKSKNKPDINYIQDDRLKEHIDWDKIMPMERYAGGHDDQMRGLIKGAKVLGHYNEGDYQGKVATAILLPDKRCALYVDYYGSCSGCDAWEDASSDDVRKLCIDLTNSAYVFKNAKDAKRWLNAVADWTLQPNSYGWDSAVAYGLLKEIGGNAKNK